TSNSPTPVRTAICSAISPEYSTGMSHPPKSTILAPMRRCMALSEVWRRAGGAELGKGGPSEMEKSGTFYVITGAGRTGARASRKPGPLHRNPRIGTHDRTGAFCAIGLLIALFCVTWVQ